MIDSGCIGEPCLRPVVGWLWQWEVDHWRRALIRQCPKCRHTEFVVVYWLDPHFPICWHCMSQDVTYQSNRVQCKACHAVTQFVEV